MSKQQGTEPDNFQSIPPPIRGIVRVVGFLIVADSEVVHALGLRLQAMQMIELASGCLQFSYFHLKLRATFEKFVCVAWTLASRAFRTLVSLAQALQNQAPTVTARLARSKMQLRIFN